jgi:hypothetical protein
MCVSTYLPLVLLASYAIFSHSEAFGWLTYMLANNPMQKVPKADMAAVAVTRSFLISAAHKLYSMSLRQGGSPATGGALHTQVPPVSATMPALTAMM